MKSKAFSMEYLNAFVARLRELAPDWIIEQAHKLALPAAGGKARWRVKPEIPEEEGGAAEDAGGLDVEKADKWLWTYRASGDGDTCPDCAELDGQTAITEANEQPEALIVPNPNCRSTLGEGNACRCTLTHEIQKSAETEPDIDPMVSILKMDSARQIVYGIVLEPEVMDSQGDICSAEEIEQAAHHYLTQSALVRKDHQEEAAAEVIESYIAPCKFTLGGNSVAPGSWVIAVHISDSELWRGVASGEYTGFSVGGSGRREAA